MASLEGRMSIDPLDRPKQPFQDQQVPNGPREPDTDSDIERGPAPLTDPPAPDVLPGDPDTDFEE
jgi:hypothetical protein